MEARVKDEGLAGNHEIEANGGEGEAEPKWSEGEKFEDISDGVRDDA